MVGYCEQDAHIFDNTIAENIRFAKQGASDDDVIASLRSVKLWDWVDSLPRGYTPTSENAARNSQVGNASESHWRASSLLIRPSRSSMSPLNIWIRSRRRH